MNTSHRVALLVALFVVLCFSATEAQVQTVGLFLNDDGAFPGYTLFAPLPYNVIYLINNEGLLVHSWHSSFKPGNSVYLLENGNLLHTCRLEGDPAFSAGGAGGRIEILDWDSKLVWEFEYCGNQRLLHHDVAMLPNGNILMIAWERKTFAEAVAAGRDPALLPDNVLWSEHIIEVDPAGFPEDCIVWEWHVWDHLIQDFDPLCDNFGVVEDHPELVDINFTGNPNAGPQGRGDWLHINAVDFNPELDQIILSTRQLSEIWIIDHSTTTSEASGHTGGNSGHGGDLLYRWGNPEAYRAGDLDDRTLFHQHNAHWIEPGLPGESHILVFNNDQECAGGSFSSVDEIIPPLEPDGTYSLVPGSPFGPTEPTWTYIAPDSISFFSATLSGAHRLPNGNTIVCSGDWGTFFEVTPSGETVWLYVNPVTSDGPIQQGEPLPGSHNGTANDVFRVYRYAPDYPGLAGQDLTPGDPIETYPAGLVGPEERAPELLKLWGNQPNPFNPRTEFTFSLARAGHTRLSIHDLGGRLVTVLVADELAAGDFRAVWNGRGRGGEPVPSGVYLARLEQGDLVVTRKIALVR